MGLLEKQESEQAQAEEESDIAELAPAYVYAKRLAFSTHDPLSRVITEVNGNLSYKIHTKSTIPLVGSDITTIVRIESGLETEIAKINWRYYVDDRSDLTYANSGQTIKLWEYFNAPDTIQFGSHTKRTFRVKEQEYSWVWTHGNAQPHFELIDINDTKLARDVREKAGFFLPYTRSGGLLINAEALDLLDEIIVTHTALAQRERMEYSVRRDMQAAAINQTLKF